MSHLAALAPATARGLGAPVALRPQVLRRREFWTIQVLVLGIAVGHTVNEMITLVDLRAAELLPVSLFLLPVSYAALVFGLRGAVATAAWSAMLTVPNVVYWHEGNAVLGELWQIGLVVAVGAVVGRRVDLERRAWGEAAARARERRASDERYRGLFTIVADPVLVLDSDGRVVEANLAGVELLERRDDSILGTTATTAIPELRGLNHGDWTRAAPVGIDRHGRRRWLHPVAVPFEEADGVQRVMVQLRDVTPAVERQRLLESLAGRTEAAREEERRRITRDLHDGPLQSLVVLVRSLDEAERGGGKRASAVLQDGRRRIEAVADDLRRFSRDLRPSILDDLGVAPALKAEVAALSARSAISATFELRGRGRRLPSEVELALLRICQEALRNVERHARAEHAVVLLTLWADRYRMRVCDDGVGVGELPSASDLVQDGRLGVVGMRERARLMGATCTIRPLTPAGTEVRVGGAIQARAGEGWASLPGVPGVSASPSAAN